MLKTNSCISLLVITALLIQIAPMLGTTDGGSLLQVDLSDLDDYSVLGREDTLTIFNSMGSGLFGTSLAAGDLNGDGLDDIAIGVPEFNMYDRAGVVMVYFARDPDELSPLYGHLDCDILIYGSNRDDKFGSSVYIDDLNNDGMDELLIGAPYGDGQSNDLRDSGEVYILEGRERSQYKPVFDINLVPLFGRIYGRDSGDRLGTDIICSDLTGDNVSDIIIRNVGSGGRASSESENENECIGSWEIDVIEGDDTGIGTVDISRSGSFVRYFGQYRTVADVYASHIGNGLGSGDMNGDGYMDLIFTYRYQGNGYASVIDGGPSFPHVQPGRTVSVHNGPDFVPMFSIDLGNEGHEEAPVTLGDLDQDGMDDLVIGLPYASARESFRRFAGQVDVYLGREKNETQSGFPGLVNLVRSEANMTIWGIDASDLMGSELLVVDSNGDGIQEIFVTAPFADGIDNYDFNVGEAYLFMMEDNVTELDQSDAFRVFMGGHAGSDAFSTVTKLQYFNDEPEELLISSPDYTSQSSGTDLVGIVSLLSQRRAFDAAFIGQFDSSLFGSTLLMDDFDQDGYHDIVVGDPVGGTNRIGHVDLFFGDENGWEGRILAKRESDISYENAEENSEVGEAIASGDLDDDGYPDLAIGAPLSGINGFWNDAGEVRIYWGDTQGNMTSMSNRRIIGDNVERVGASIAIDDVNDDGMDDLIYSAPYDQGPQSNGRYHAGVVCIMFGPIDSSSNFDIRSRYDYDVRIMGSMPSEFIGESLDTGDIDGDGLTDVIIGAPKSSRGSVNRQGLTYVLKGRSSWPSIIDLQYDDALKIFGPWPFDEAGSELCSADLDMDGKEELVIGSDKGDGFERSILEAGNAYILKGEFLASRMPNGTVMLRTESNVSITGDMPLMKLGSSIAIGDITGRGSPDVIIGAYGWTDPISNFQTGALIIFPSGLLSDRKQLNATSLPTISGFSDEDEAGRALAVLDITNDGKEDLLIGAPGADPLMEGNDPGAVYYWEGKDLFYRPNKSSTLTIDGADIIAGELGRAELIVEPLEGPYSFSLNARSVTGYQDITSIQLEIMNTSLPGSAILTLDTVLDDLSLSTTGAYNGRISLMENESTFSHDNIQTWFVDFKVKMEWNFPDSDTILTRVTTNTETDTNYLSQPFVMDHRVDLDASELHMVLVDETRNSRWLNSTSEFVLSGISLLHGITGEQISDNSSEGMVFSVYRPDGLKIGSAVPNGSHLVFTNLTPGDGLASEGIIFSISPSSLPTGAEWTGNQTFQLDVDSIAPPPLSSFTIFPDGKETSSRYYDDDELVELFWNSVNDNGGSGIGHYELTIIDEDGTKDVMTDAESGDLLLIPRGNTTLSILAVDRAGNRGPWTNFTLIIDVTDPVFGSPTPAANSWINVEMNRFSILVEDMGSGIDPKSAYYRVYRSDVDLLSDWMPVTIRRINEDGSIRFNATVPESDSYGNYIQWRVSDMVGITSISDPMSYNMDTRAPVIEIEKEEMFLGPVEFRIEAYMQDILSGLNLSSISYRIASQGDISTEGWKNMGLTGTGASSILSVPVLPAFRGWGFAQWRVKDNAENWVESDFISVFIDEEYPEFDGFEPNGSRVQISRKVTVSVMIQEEESGIGPDDVEFSISTMSGWITYGVGGFSPWEVVTDVVDDGYGTYTASVRVALDEGPLNRIRFRTRDIAGNGWVISPTLTLERETVVENLPPTALFTLIPAVDFIYSGDEIILDASASDDPEDENLSYTWFSDLEDFPSTEVLGRGKVINISLQRIGVHRIWLEVSDGRNKVSSEELPLRVIEEETQEDDTSGSEQSVGDAASDAFLFIIIALLIGILIGAFIAYKLFERGDDKEEDKVDDGPWVEAKYEPDYSVPYCPYCDSEVRMSDEYCMTCGQLFSPEDKEKMEKDMKKGKKKKKRSKKRDLLPQLEEPMDTPDDDLIDDELQDTDEDEALKENPFLEGPEDDIEPPSEDDIIEDMDEEYEEYDEIVDIEDFEDMEEMEDIDDIEFEDDWEVNE